MINKKIRLDNRKILKISGIKNTEFLNNILTIDIFKLKANEVLPCALLSPQGRIIFDILISFSNSKKFNNDNLIYIEHDIDQQEDLIKKLNIYNLRKDVSIEKTNYEVFVTTEHDGYHCTLVDKRFFDDLVNRIYVNNDLESKNTNIIDNQYLNWYDLLRYKNCILEGSKEIMPNVSLPLETNLDLLGGISFKKGCFIGQEVNARIKWKGLVKRKYVPILLKDKKMSYLKLSTIDKKEIFLNNKLIGEIVVLSYSREDGFWYGIAKIKLSDLYNFEKDNTLEANFLDSKIKVNFPKFMLPLPKKI